MNFTRSVTPPPGQLNPSFHEFLHAIQEEAESVLSLPTHQESEAKTTQVANRFFTYLLENLQRFDGATQDLNTLVDRLNPFKSAELKIEPLLTKIIKDFRIKTQKLIDISSEKVVPFSSSLAAFPLPLLDTTTKTAELTTQFLREERNDFSLRETLEMCCLLSSQTMETQATLLFNLYTIKHFVEDPQGFTEQLLDYTREVEGLLPQSTIQNNTMILRRLFQASISQSTLLDLFFRIPPELFIWLQNGGPGEKELFQGYEQLLRKNYNEAFEFFKKAADLGNSQALVEMGNCYYTGGGVPAKDCNEAFEFFKKAADLGNSQALIGMGNCYYTGYGVQAPDYNKAFKLYKQAADLGNSQALTGMGNCYYTGHGVPAQDFNKAFKLYKQAADLGNSQGLVQMGCCYYTGHGVPAQDYNKAFEFYKKAADLGSSQALTQIGDCYYTGNGVPAQDYNKAFELHKQAADLGNSRALIEMGDCYYTGNGVQAQDYNKAFDFYKQAAALGESQGLVRMADCYYDGYGVPKNHEEAFKHWVAAKNLGNILGALKAAKCLTFGQGTPKDLTEAKIILLDLISKNSPEASSFYNKHF